MKRDRFEHTVDRLIATCPCDVCVRYRKAFAARAGYYAAQIEESLRTTGAVR
jgi:hypothetical protein